MTRWRIGARHNAAAADIGVDRWCLAVTLLSLVILLPASWWGLPNATSELSVRGWDVDGIAGIGVLSELHNLLVDPKPDWYTAYPLLHYLVLAVAYAPYLAVLVATGGLQSPTGTYPFGFHDPVAALRALSVIARVVSVAMACGTVAVTYLIGRTIWSASRGVVAAMLVALTVPFEFYARTGNLDIPVLFWTALAILTLVRARMLGLTTKRAIAIGVAAALAVGTKDQAYGALLPAVLVVAIGVLAKPNESGWKPVGVLIATGLVTLLLANGFPFRPERLVRHIRFVTDFQSTFDNVKYANVLTIVRERSLSGSVLLLGDIARAVSAAVGAPVLIAGVAGAMMQWRRAPASRLLVWMIPGFVVLTVFPIRHMQYRYALLPALVLSLFAAAFLTDLVERSPRWRLAGIAAMSIAVGWPMVTSVDLTYQMARDARYAASEWLAAATHAGDRIAFFGQTHQLPYFLPGVVPVELEKETDPGSRLRSGEFRLVLVIPDFFADSAREHSIFLPDSIYRGLKDGSLGYRRADRFVTAPLLPRPLPYLPYVNPMVQIFEWRGANTVAR
jgi:hypothetical protein